MLLTFNYAKVCCLINIINKDKDNTDDRGMSPDTSETESVQSAASGSGGSGGSGAGQGG